MAYTIKNKNGSIALFHGRRVTALDTLAEVKDLDREKKEFTIVASNSAKDRMGDIIETKGIDTTDYLTNPIIQAFHDYRRAPVGTCVRLWKEVRAGVGRLMARVRLHDFSEEARLLWNLYSNKIMRGASIGFSNLASEPLDKSDDDDEGAVVLGGRRFKKILLLEISLVPLPAAAGALSEIKGYVREGRLDIPRRYLVGLDGHEAGDDEVIHLI